jgi:hypothetical protein
MNSQTFALRRPLLAVAFGLLATSVPLLSAQELFEPPVPYSSSRYQARWQADQNPFNRETAPTVIDRKSFAEDLAIASYFGSKDNPTLVIVNTKTRDRVSLRKGVAAGNGITLESISLAPVRSQVTAEVSLGGEKATLKYDDSYLRQMAAPPGKDAAGERAGTVASQPGSPLTNPGATAKGSTPSAPPQVSPNVRRHILVPRGPDPSLPGGNVAPQGYPSASRVPSVPDRNSRRTNTAPIRPTFPGAPPAVSPAVSPP